MTDQNFTAEQREIIETMFHHASVGEFLEGMSHYVRDLKNLRPNPPHPTLADMTPEERRDCQWMQADTAGADDTCVLFVIGTRSAKGVAKCGRVTIGPHECFTPRPDLPRLQWPDNDQ